MGEEKTRKSINELLEHMKRDIEFYVDDKHGKNKSEALKRVEENSILDRIKEGIKPFRDEKGWDVGINGLTYYIKHRDDGGAMIKINVKPIIEENKKGKNELGGAGGWIEIHF